jgi:hypothetical protein
MTRCSGGWGKKVALGNDKNHFGDVKKESSIVNGFGFARSGYAYLKYLSILLLLLATYLNLM